MNRPRKLQPPSSSVVEVLKDVRSDLDPFAHARGNYVDILADIDAYVYEFDMPGMARDDLQVQVTKQDPFTNRLSIKSKRQRTFEYLKNPLSSLHEYPLRDRPMGIFDREILLEKDVDLEKVTASSKGGVLTVTVPRLKGVPLLTAKLPKLDLLQPSTCRPSWIVGED